MQTVRLINPRMTIADTGGPHWLVTFEHDFRDGGQMVLSVNVSRSDRPLDSVQKEAFERAAELLDVLAADAAIDASMTVDNTEGQRWLVSFDHVHGEGERVTLASIGVDKTDQSVKQVKLGAIQEAKRLLTLVAERCRGESIA